MFFTFFAIKNTANATKTPQIPPAKSIIASNTEGPLPSAKICMHSSAAPPASVVPAARNAQIAVFSLAEKYVSYIKNARKREFGKMRRFTDESMRNADLPFAEEKIDDFLHVVAHFSARRAALLRRSQRIRKNPAQIQQRKKRCKNARENHPFFVVLFFRHRLPVTIKKFFHGRCRRAFHRAVLRNAFHNSPDFFQPIGIPRLLNRLFRALQIGRAICYVVAIRSEAMHEIMLQRREREAA